MPSSDRSVRNDGGSELERMAIRDRKRKELERRIAASAMTEPVYVDGEEHLSELLSANRIVLVDFYADWCGPCKMLEPIVTEVAADTPAVVAKVDIDRHQGIAGAASVRGVPTLVLYVDGEPAERMVGVQDKSRIVDVIERHA